MRKKIIYFSTTTIITLSLLFTIFLNDTYSSFDAKNVKDTISMLSSSTLNGRLAGTTENTMTGDLIKNKFESYGLVPLKDDYKEDFSTLCPIATNTSPYLKISSNGKVEEELQYGVDFKEDMINFRNNTFTFSKNDTISVYMSHMEVTCKDGKFLLFVPRENNFSFRSSFISDFDYDAAVMISTNTFKKISDSIKNNKEVSIHLPFTREEKTISNVIGVIKGYNKNLPPFIVTAHYDHLGTDGLGNTYGGALDNASGASFILELARSLSTYGTPSRDIIFVALNAEEFGLLGSKYFAENNLFDIKDSQVINFDMIGSANYPITFMQGTNYKNVNSNLLNSLKEICKSQGTNYEIAYQSSSDHASFNNFNIDAVTFCHDDMSKIHTLNDTVDFIDTDAITTVYNVVDAKIKSTCYNGLIRFIYSSQSILYISMTLGLLLAWGILDIRNSLMDKHGKKIFCVLGILAIISSSILYFKGYTDAIIITLVFLFSLITLLIKNKEFKFK